MAIQTLPILKQGDSGEAIRFLEQLLSSLYWGFKGNPGMGLVQTLVTFDGNYDSQTTKAVREFQENYNITFPPPAPNIQVDGQVGEETWRALGDAIFRATY
ncbi:MAG: peptidoglycan-binding protein [Cyanosarcina radialis HA8281-LM2]|jgi:peptidoglycan hydrolase-like protein with peptidoglycan-binding domain|nr:peptidoglycan-binding protein [Cyanosarcina radialis HA8281-LM2]